MSRVVRFLFFFFNDTATTEIYTLSLHDALPISRSPHEIGDAFPGPGSSARQRTLSLLLHLIGRSFSADIPDRKSTRLNSSHLVISYAVFCLKKKKRCTRMCAEFETESISHIVYS